MANKKEFLYQALRIRMIEEEIARRYHDQEMRCPVHLSIGQEMNAVAIATLLRPQDFMVSTHRAHAHYLAKGGSLDALIGELYGKANGFARGNGGSMHCIDKAAGFIGATSIVGGTIPVGVGAAFASKIKKEDRVTAVCIGDAAVEEGVFHESANFAGLHRLPVIFYLEDNKYSCFTHIRDRQPARDFKQLARAHGLSYEKINYPTIYEDTEALKKKGIKLPVLIESEAYRFIQHCGPDQDDNLNYRQETEIAYHVQHDPLDALMAELGQDQVDIIKRKVDVEIKSAFHTTKKAQPPNELELGAYLYA